ncbi:hypothetical protein ZIOFF_022282 [Zingiber officinale]|uniref:SAM-dependent MTase RsmB/NOP-type domain-containing protein n=1 Tax=Zingiber officinale TaxID=94328 RepID=A0A8J5H1C6_ZINOF|nr:hypothetical protein ZIOFF_022282 [Zingiber officinale]
MRSTNRLRVAFASASTLASRGAAEMGGGRKRGRTQRRHFKQGRENVWKYGNKEARPDDPSAADKPNPTWQPFATQNANFDEYYKVYSQHILEQHIVPEDEWEDFISMLRKPLPAAFRINSSFLSGHPPCIAHLAYFSSTIAVLAENYSSGQFCKDILLQLENDFITSLKHEVNDECEVEAIRSLPWYPDNLAWHLNFSRMQLRKSQTLERFHEFLKQENEVGNITRQEAVSMVVPPLFLDVHPDHYVLDMCAAPGSKTFQLLEMIHHSIEPGLLPNGLVVIANDVDVQRCNLLIHQTKRMSTANLVVTNHEAQYFPTYPCVKDYKETLKGEKELMKGSLQFDRILCDVPCSGDGTLRKAPDIWRKWNAGMGNGLHRLQVEIAMRGNNIMTLFHTGFSNTLSLLKLLKLPDSVLMSIYMYLALKCEFQYIHFAQTGVALLKVGGRMVYSTCSMNPVENEAVVAEVLRRSANSIKLLDVSGELSELVRRPGLKTWKVGLELYCPTQLKDRGLWLASHKDVPQYRRGVIVPSMFPSGKSHDEILKYDGQENAEILGSNSFAENVNKGVNHSESVCVQHQALCKNLVDNAPLTESCTIESKIEEVSSESVSIEKHHSYFREVSEFPLENCMRILPHDQNTGAFFIAVFEKLSPLMVAPIKPARQSAVSGDASPDDGENLVVECNDKIDLSSSSQDGLINNASLATIDVDTKVEKSPAVSDNDAVSIHTRGTNLNEARVTNEEERLPSETKAAKGKLQTEGKWRGVDPVVFFKNHAIINSIRSYYGISDSFPLDDHLVTRNTDPNHIKRIYYISKSVNNILQLNIQSGERLKITSLGLKIFERQKSSDKSYPCSFRLSSEGLPLLLPYIKRQILYAPLADFQLLLKHRTVKFTDFVDASFSERASSLMPGCCVLCLNEGDEPRGDEVVVDSSTIAIICWKGKTNLSILLSPSDGQELLERVALRFGIQSGISSQTKEDGKDEIDELENSSPGSMNGSDVADEEVALMEM